MATLPTEVAGISLDGVQIVDESLWVGHAVDDVLATLGKRRSDATSVFRYGGQIYIGAMTVSQVTGEALLEACVQAWDAAAVIQRDEITIAGKTGWELTERHRDSLTFFYQLGDVVYVAWSDSRPLKAVIADMP